MKSKICFIELNGQKFAVFQCATDEDFKKFKSAKNMKPPVFVKVRHLRLFYGNAVISEE